MKNVAPILGKKECISIWDALKGTVKLDGSGRNQAHSIGRHLRESRRRFSEKSAGPLPLRAL